MIVAGLEIERSRAGHLRQVEIFALQFVKLIEYLQRVDNSSSFKWFLMISDYTYIFSKGLSILNEQLKEHFWSECHILENPWSQISLG